MARSTKRNKKNIHYSHFQTLTIVQNILQQGGLASPKEARKDGDGQTLHFGLIFFLFDILDVSNIVFLCLMIVVVLPLHTTACYVGHLWLVRVEWGVGKTTREREKKEKTYIQREPTGSRRGTAGEGHRSVRVGGCWVLNSHPTCGDSHFRCKIGV